MRLPPVTLLMAIHCHQPVGNFGFVFEQAYADAYEPFLATLERHPQVRLALHYSGSLLDWLEAHQPRFLQRVKRLVARGQVELLASGYYEPMLPLIPDADRQGQLAMMREALRRHVGTEARGLWLTERVWEPEMPQTLARAGLRYTMVDTNQFACAAPWLPSTLQVRDEAFWDILGCYTTDYAGSSVTLFPASKRLRYWMPFQPVERTIEFLRRLRRAEAVAITFADDGEKFGLWPKTHDWVYREGWLERFFAALERERDWLATDTFASHLSHAVPNGQVSLPSGSYEEMLEWSGGHFRNFFAKYAEANAMQHKMLAVSQRLQDIERSAYSVQRAGRKSARRLSSHLSPHTSRLVSQARRELYAGQCNCAYWHGVFGGLYLGHLRRAVYRHLLDAEALLNRVDAPDAVVVHDADGDGQPDVRVTTPAMTLLVDLAEGGAITEWSLYDARINVLDALTRRPEAYHEKLRAAASQPTPARQGPASIHDLVGVKEPNLAASLVYDDHRRSSFLAYGLERAPSLQEVMRATWGELRLWSGGAYRVSGPGRRRAQRRGPHTVAMEHTLDGGQVRKTLRVERRRPAFEATCELLGVRAPVLALEWTLGVRDPRYLSAPGEHQALRRFTLEEPEVGVSLTLELDPPATLLHVPIDTVSESEEGLERTYQGLGLLCLWTPAGGPSWAAHLRWSVA